MVYSAAVTVTAGLRNGNTLPSSAPLGFTIEGKPYLFVWFSHTGLWKYSAND